MSAARATSDREIVLTRVLDAPRELVFDAWTDRKHIAQWWGPRGFTTTIHEMDVRPGGVWRFMMHGPDGVDYPNRIVFREVVKPERLVYDHGSDDPADPAQFHVTVTFAKQGVTDSPGAALLIQELRDPMAPSTARQGRIRGGLRWSAKGHKASSREREESMRHRPVRRPLSWRREFGDDLAAMRHQHRFAGPDVPNVFAQATL